MAKSVRQIPGVLFADVNFATGMLLLEYDRDRDPRPRAVATVVGAGHGVEPLDADDVLVTAPSWWTHHRAEVAVAVSGALIVLGWLIGSVGAEVASVAAYGLAIMAGGTITWRRAVVSLQARTLDMNVLMTIAVSGAAAIGEWGEGATVMFLFALGGILESRSVARTRRSIRDLMSLAPERARVRRGGVESEVSPAEVAVGEAIVVRPGERVPLDGIIVHGVSAFDESPITGESIPADRGVGDRVFSGALNTTGLVEVRTTAPASETTLARIVHLVEAAQASRAPVQRFVDRFSRWYTPIVIAGAAFLAIGVPLLGELTGAWPGVESWQDWTYRSLVLLVVSCPCALVVSTPVAIVSAITRATRDGVLVKGGAFLEFAGKARVVVFDKTGTLTEGRPTVAEVVPLASDARQRILGLAAALESHSNHPLARAVAAAGVDDASGLTVSGVAETPGRGVTGVVDGEDLVVGNLAFVSEHVTATGDVGATAARLEDAGLTVLALARTGGDGSVLGLLGLADAVRPEAATTTAALSGAGIEHVVMLTGDNERAAARVAAAAGVAEFRARLLPEDKTAEVTALRERHGVVVMVGDGINDAPALAAADVGVAMGAAGSDTAIETADVALMRDDLSALPRFLALGRATMANIRQNVALSLGVKAVVLVLAITGHATLWMAVFADTGVALIVIANGLRLLRRR
ncbi:MAG: cation-translocating P-type ATPase [Coriobacteriia bacterium]|nr:cation-translocating P-type ATPase [Coriobacteriia bacterium]